MWGWGWGLRLRLLCIFINLPSTHVWNTVVKPELVPIVAICRTVCPSLAASLEPLADCRNVASLSLFYMYYFGDVLLNWLNWFHFLFFWGRPTCYSDRLHNFSVTIPRCCKDIYINSFFPGYARLWNFLLIECFRSTYKLNSFNSRINRHLLTVGSL